MLVADAGEKELSPCCFEVAVYIENPDKVIVNDVYHKRFYCYLPLKYGRKKKCYIRFEVFCQFEPVL